MDFEQILYMIVVQKKVDVKDIFTGVDMENIMSGSKDNSIQFDVPLEAIFMNDVQAIGSFLIT